VDRSCGPMNKKRIKAVPTRASGQVTAKLSGPRGGGVNPAVVQ
jgi:hypothetical protein